MRSQFEAICAVGISLDDLSASTEVVVVNGGNKFRLGKAEFIVAAVDINAAEVEFRAHRAIGENRWAVKAFAEVGVAGQYFGRCIPKLVFSSCLGLSSATAPSVQ